MHFDFVLFDLDGTLFDYHRAEKDALQKLFNFFQIPGNFTDLREKYTKINLATWEEFRNHKITADELKTKRFKLFSDKLKLDIPPTKFSTIYQKFLSEARYLLDGSLDLLNQLQNKGVQMSLITNGLAEVQNKRLDNSPITDYFSDVFISEEVGIAKPHPGIFRHIFKKNESLEKKQTLIIGDNLLSDIKGGNDFGIKTCWFNPEGLKNETEIIPDYEIKQLNEILDIIEI